MVRLVVRRLGAKLRLRPATRRQDVLFLHGRVLEQTEAHALLLACGLLTGTFCALLAIAPVVNARGGRLPFASLGLLLAVVVVAGIAASLVATAAALRAPLLAALREE